MEIEAGLGPSEGRGLKLREGRASVSPHHHGLAHLAAPPLETFTVVTVRHINKEGLQISVVKVVVCAV